MAKQGYKQLKAEVKAREEELNLQLAQARADLISSIYQLTPDIIEDKIGEYFTSENEKLAEAASRCFQEIYQKGISLEQHARTIDRFFLDNKQFYELRGMARSCITALEDEPNNQKHIVALEKKWDKVLADLIEANRPFIEIRARKYGSPHSELVEEYLQVGLEELRRVLRSYDYAIGTLSGYSYQAVETTMAKAREKDNISISELILDASISSESEDSLLDRIADESHSNLGFTEERLATLDELGEICQKILTEREYGVIRIKWFDGNGAPNNAEVGLQMGIGDAAVSRLEINAFKKLRKNPRAQKLGETVLKKRNP